MAKPSKPAERIKEKQASLLCGICGAGNRLTNEALEHGWFSCGHCESPSPIPGVGDFAIQGPAGRVTRIVRPGSSEFETAEDLLLPLRYATGYLIVANLISGAVIQGIEMYGPQYAVLAKAVAVTLLLAAWGISYLFVKTRQELAVRADRVEFCLRTFGRKWRQRGLATEKFRTLPYYDGRTGVELRALQGRIFIRIEGVESIRWLEREIQAAIRDAAGSASTWLACPGCGGPVAPEKALKEAGGIDCPHCLTGLVQTEGGIALPAVDISMRRIDGDEAEAPASQRRETVTEWCSPPWSQQHPIAAPINLLVIFALCAGVVVAAWWGVFATPALEVVAAAVALGLTFAVPKAFMEALLWLYGAHNFRFSARALEHSVRLGARVYKRRAIPLLRLLSLDASRDRMIEDSSVLSDAINITARTATREISFDVYGTHMQSVVRAIFTEASARIEALGRKVKVKVKGRRKPPRS